nr:DUF2071 domain-containing protein [uncultured Fluviicola sp.]
MKKSNKNTLLQSISHRKWPLPVKRWSYYQEWNKALFLHWKVPADTLQRFLPSGLKLDTFENEAWISVVAFTMEKIRPKNLPAFSPISNFHEINIRTYIINNGKPGVYFLNIEAQKLVSAKLSKLLSGLPYEKAKMKRNLQTEVQTYHSNQQEKGFEFAANYQVFANSVSKSELDIWLTERYCLYLDKNEKNYLYEIHHLPWELQEVEISGIRTNYRIGSIDLNRKPDLIHYSKGVNVIAWKKEVLLSK